MDSKRYQILSANRKRRALGRLLFFLIGFSAIVAVIGYVIPNFIDWDVYRKDIERSLTDAFGSKVSVNGSISGSFLLPKLEIKRVRVSYADEVSFLGRVELRLSILSLLRFSPKVTAVLIQDADFFVDKFPGLFLAGGFGGFKQRNVVLKNIALKSSGYLGLLRGLMIQHADLDVDSDSLSLTGRINIGDGLYLLDMSSDKRSSNCTISSDSMKLLIAFDGNEGKIRGRGDNILPLISDVFDLKLTQPEQSQFTIESQLLLSEDGYSINNMKIESEYLKVLVDILWGRENYNFKVVVNELNFDKLFSEGSDSANFWTSTNLVKMLDCLDHGISDNSEGNFMLSAKNIMYHSGVVEDVLLKASMHAGEIKIDVMNALLPGNSTFNVLGAVKREGSRSKFEGEVALIGISAHETLDWLFPSEGLARAQEDDLLDCRAKMVALPNLLMLSEISAKIGQSAINGELKLQDNLGEGLFSGVLVAENIDFDKYYDYFWSQISQRRSRFGFEFALEVDMYNCMLHQNNFSNVSFYLDSNKNIMMLDHIKFASESTDFEGSIVFDYTDLRPSVELAIQGKSMDSSLFDFIDLFEILPNDSYELGYREAKWSQKPLNWLDLRSVDGKISLKFDRVLSKTFELNKFQFAADFKDSVVSISQFNFGVNGGGVVTTVGNIGIEDDTSISISFAANSIALKDAFAVVDVNSVSGGMSCNGSLRSRGRSVEELVYNLSGVMNFSFRDVLLEGLNSDKLIDELLGVRSKAELATLTQVGLFDGATRYRSIDGSANIRGGILGLSLQFLTERSSGFLSSNFSLLKFAMNGIARHFFVLPDRVDEVLFVDMNVQGSLWRPKVFFDDDKLYDLISSSRKN